MPSLISQLEKLNRIMGGNYIFIVDKGYAGSEKYIS